MKSYKRFNPKSKASLTIEASLVLPVFIFGILTFIYLLQITILQNNLQEAITNVALDLGKYGYVHEDIKNPNTGNEGLEEEGDSSLQKVIAGTIDSLYLKEALSKEINVEAINSSVIKNGFNGIYTYFSTYMEEEDEIDIILNYDIELPLPFISLNDFTTVQRVKLRSWDGYHPGSESEDETNSDDKNVYITPTGSVYHTSANCSHIKLSIRSVPGGHVKDLRNESGGKYKSCERCCPGAGPASTVYITSTGDRYHNHKDCSGLKRTVIQVPLSEVEDRNPCKKCGQ